MDKINVNYKITIYDDNYNEKIIDNLHDIFDSDILFPDMVDSLARKNNINCFQIYVANLKSNTWGRILNEDLCIQMDGDDIKYKWLRYKVGDVQKAFNLFDNKINIVANASGFGKVMGEEEGIRFYINNNEKDYHQFEPHVHCEYSGEEMRIRIDTLVIMKKDKAFKNKKKVKKAISWVKNHQESLLKFYNSFAINEDNSIIFEVVI